MLTVTFLPIEQPVSVLVNITSTVKGEDANPVAKPLLVIEIMDGLLEVQVPGVVEVY